MFQTLRRTATRGIQFLSVLTLSTILLSPTALRAGDDFWDGNVVPPNPPSGIWGTGANWVDNTTPGNGDTATFDVGLTYTVTFDANPLAIQALTNSSGIVRFASSGATRTLMVNAAGGSQDVTVTSSATLSLGNLGPVTAFHLTVGDDLIVNGNATLNAALGSQINTVDLLLAQSGGNGTIDIGTFAQLNVANSLAMGLNGNSATLTYHDDGGGTLSFVGLATSNVAGSTAILNVESDADLNTDTLSVGAGGVGTMGTLNINGSGSTLTQSGASQLIVGGSTGGVGNVNIGTTVSGGTLTTGTGTLNIRAPGTVTIASASTAGTLNANGNVLVDGGTLQSLSGGGQFNLAAGKTMTVQNGGSASFAGFFTTASNANYIVTDAGSMLSSGVAININSNAQIDVTSGGSLSSAIYTDIGSGTNGTLTVDGAGSSATAGIGGNLSLWAEGATANVAFSNGASGIYDDGIGMAFSGVAGSTAIVDVLSGADLTVGNLQLAPNGGSTSATLTVSEPGSTVTLNPATDLTIGHVSQGSAVINVNDGASLAVGAGGTTILNATGTVNLDGGFVDLQTLNDNGGTINFIAGSLSYIGDLNVGGGGLLGNNLTLGNQHVLTLSGTTTVDAFRELTLDGGSLSTDTLVVNGTFTFNAGSLTITGAGGLTVGVAGPFGASLSVGAGQNLDVTNTLTVENGATLSLSTGSNIIADTVANSGVVQGKGAVAATLFNQSGGVVRVQPGDQLGFVGATHTNDGDFQLQGGRIDFEGTLVNSATGNILGRGTLSTGGLTNAGQMLFSAGLTDVFGTVEMSGGVGEIIVTGLGTTTFFDDVVHNGDEIRVSAGSTVVFFGDYSGAGPINCTGGGGSSCPGNVFFEAGVSPGASPAAVSMDVNFGLGNDALLEIELGGLSAGNEYDQLNVTGAAALAGTLDVSLIDPADGSNIFQPELGNTFDILTAAAVTGAFTSESFPDLGSLLVMDAFYDANTVTLAVVPALPGDYNADGVVGAGDYTVWRNTLNQIGIGLPADGTGPTPGVPDGIVNQLDYAFWKTHYGDTIPGSGLSLADGAANVPEPSALLLLTIGGICVCLGRLSTRGQNRTGRG